MLLPRDFIRRCAASYPDKAAFVDGDRIASWGAMHERSGRLAGALQAMGVAKGDVVAILSHDHLEVVEHWFACMKLGAVRVGINWRYAPREILHLIRDAGARILFVQANCVALLDEIRGEIDSAGVRLIGYGEDHGLPDDYETLLTNHGAPMELPPLAPEDLIALSYTTGTTGLPKGALWTQRGVLDCVVNSMLQLGLQYEDSYFAPFPMAGVPILCGTLGMVTGMTVILPDGDFNPQRALELMTRHRATAAIFVPTMLQAVLNTYKAGDYDLSALRLLTYGSSPATPALIRDAMETFGCEIMQLYGLTESTAGWLSFLRHDEHLRGLAGEPHLLTSCGKPALHADLSIRSPQDGQEVPIGEVGELWARGTTNIPGYLNLPAENAELFSGEWLRTNDLARRDAEGFYYLTDRRKFMIITGGYNVYPVVVENVLAEHPAVAEVTVVGVPHPHWGEAVVAVIAKRPNADASEQELIDFCRGRVGRWEVPKHIEFVDALPKGATGKIAKYQIREWLRDGIDHWFE